MLCALGTVAGYCLSASASWPASPGCFFTGRPLRAGSSVIDITGGMFGVIGILAALQKRHRTGAGGDVKCSLYETTAFLVGQHMAQMAVTGKAAQPMPVRVSAWAIYDVFDTKMEGEQLFVGVVSDGQWVTFCQAFGLDALGANPDYAVNNQRVLAREVILPQVRALFGAMERARHIRHAHATMAAARPPPPGCCR